LEIERGHIDLFGKFLQLVEITPIGAQQRGDLPCTGILRAVNDEKAVAKRCAGERKHARQLAAAKNADGRHNYSCPGSGCASTLSVCSRRKASSRPAMAGSRIDRIAAANKAALMAPARPIANVATGIPAGICTIESSESIPFNACDWTGTPSTGIRVLAASIPGRCAAPPAPAMIAQSPRESASAA